MSLRQHQSKSIALNDVARGLAQQMVFWGYDVRHPEGNALVHFGLKRAPSPGLAGTSCYSIKWQGGVIELHGAVASWTAPAGIQGCQFDREKKRVVQWNGASSPIPGRESGETASSDEMWRSLQPLLSWLVSYEEWVFYALGGEWRDGCWRALKRLPMGKSWLPPLLALAWWQEALHSVPPRPKRFLKIPTP